MEAVHLLNIAELTKRYAAGMLSPREVTEVTLQRIAALDAKINSFSLVMAKQARAAASSSEVRWRAGKPLGPLDGVPVSIKDTLKVFGQPFRRGSRATSDEPANENAPVVDRVLELGAVPLGITTTPEFGAGPITISPLTGVTRNPWNITMNSGGSSGGAAASIAAGLGHAALATDAGGSIRIPSCFCGVVGMKPTGGRVPAYPPNVAGALSAPGAITRSVADAVLMLQVLARPDSRDVECLPPPPEDWLDRVDAAVTGLRVAVSIDLGYARRVDPEVAAAVRTAAQTMEALGAAVTEAYPDAGDPLPTFNTLFRAGFGYAMKALGNEQQALIGETLRQVADLGAQIPLQDYLAAQDARRSLARAYAQFFERFDLLVTPMVSVTAFEAERWVPKDFEDLEDPRAWTPFGYPVNLIQSPAITVPCGLSSTGLPIGLQIVGPRFAEATVLSMALAYERARGDSFGEPTAVRRTELDESTQGSVL